MAASSARTPHDPTTFARLTREQALAIAGDPDLGAAGLGLLVLCQRLPWALRHEPTEAEIAAACRRSARWARPLLRRLRELGAASRTRRRSRDPWRFTAVGQWAPDEPEHGVSPGWHRVPHVWIEAVRDGRASCADLGRLVVALVTSTSPWGWETRREFRANPGEAAGFLAPGRGLDPVAPDSVTRSVREFVRAGLLEREGRVLRVPAAIERQTWARPKPTQASNRERAETDTGFRPSRAGKSPPLVSGLRGSVRERERAHVETRRPEAANGHGASSRTVGRATPRRELPDLPPEAQAVLDRVGCAGRRWLSEDERDRWGALAVDVLRRPARNHGAVLRALVRVGQHAGVAARAEWAALTGATPLERDEAGRFRRAVTCASCDACYQAPADVAGTCPACGAAEGSATAPDREDLAAWSAAVTGATVGHTMPARERPRDAAEEIGRLHAWMRSREAVALEAEQPAVLNRPDHDAAEARSERVRAATAAGYGHAIVEAMHDPEALDRLLDQLERGEAAA